MMTGTCTGRGEADLHFYESRPLGPGDDKYIPEKQGPSFAMSENEIRIDGLSFSPITVINAAVMWLEWRTRMNWKLKDFRGNEIVVESLLKRIV